MKLDYSFATQEGTVLEDSESFNGALELIFPVSNEHISSISAKLSIKASDEEKIFMNGFQTWTTCPEYRRTDRIRGVNGIPKTLVRRFSLDRYGDYHFSDYPHERGLLMGWSWCYFRRGGYYRLFASLDESNGYTRFLYDDSEGSLTISKDCEGLLVDGDFSALSLYYAEGSEEQVFDAWFAMMDIKPITDKKICGYSSWYNRYQDIDEKSIMEDLEGCSKILREGDLFQVDDGWEPFVGDWMRPDFKKFPNGMKAVADAIHAKGYKAGLWLAPFAAEKDSYMFTHHPDWFIHEEGEPWINGCNWSGFYSFDIDKPEVITYLRNMFTRVFDEWGFDLVKLDFLYVAAPHGSETETRAGRMIRAVNLLRELCGDHPILGCGVPVMAAFGKFEYCRISCDVTLDWDDKAHMRLIHRERPSTRNAIANIISRKALNGRAWLSDPDVFFLRESNCQLTERQKFSLGVLDALSGGVFLTSDNPSEYSEDTIEKYNTLRHLTEAENVRFVIDNETSVVYDLDDETTRRRLLF